MGRYFNKDKFSKRLLELMVDNNDTTYSLGEYLHLSNASISRYTTGRMAPKVPTVQAIAEKYGVNPAWLMGTEGADKYTDKARPDVKRIPIIGTITAGVPILAHENIEGYEVVPENASVDFCLRVKGDSMIGARILDGDLVYIRKQPTVDNGEIAAVIIDDEATLKRFYKFNGSVLLRSENPNYPEQRYTKKDMKQILILGKAIFFRSEVR